MVHKLAELDGMPKGLKIANRGANQIIFDSAWIAGVDYDEELFNDEDYDEEDDDDQDEDESYYNMVEEYDEMDKNKLADLGEEARSFNVPNEGNRYPIQDMGIRTYKQPTVKSKNIPKKRH
jgi:hypothetical protein